MLDFGFSELLLVIAIAVFVIGPEEIPKIMVTLGRITRRLAYIKYAFSQQFEDFMREADLEDIRRRVNFEEDKRGFDEAAHDEAEEPDAEREEDEAAAKVEKTSKSARKRKPS